MGSIGVKPVDVMRAAVAFSAFHGWRKRPCNAEIGGELRAVGSTANQWEVFVQAASSSHGPRSQGPRREEELA